MPDAAAERDEARVPTSAVTVTPAATIGAPSAARQQRDRNQHAELRLVGEADRSARLTARAGDRAVQRAAEQCRGEKSVLAVADIDEHGGEGRGDQAASPAAAGCARIAAR